MGAARYYRKPVPVDAWQVTADNADDAAAWVEANSGSVIRYQPHVKRLSGIEATHAFQVSTPKGYAWVHFGEYVVHDPWGFTVVTPGMLAAAYEPAEGVPDAAAQQ